MCAERLKTPTSVLRKLAAAVGFDPDKHRITSLKITANCYELAKVEVQMHVPEGVGDKLATMLKTFQLHEVTGPTRSQIEAKPHESLISATDFDRHFTKVCAKVDREARGQLAESDQCGTLGPPITYATMAEFAKSVAERDNKDRAKLEQDLAETSQWLKEEVERINARLAQRGAVMENCQAMNCDAEWRADEARRLIVKTASVNKEHAASMIAERNIMDLCPKCGNPPDAVSEHEIFEIDALALRCTGCRMLSIAGSSEWVAMAGPNATEAEIETAHQAWSDLKQRMIARAGKETSDSEPAPVKFREWF